MKDVESIADALLAQFKFENPLIENLYIKLDNAGCYHGELVPEALFKVCKTNNFNLKRYDYNEPRKGKDQFGATSLMRSLLIQGMTEQLLILSLHQSIGWFT